MTTDERKRIGLRLRAMRVERGLDQVEVARRAQVAVGTVQSIENALRETRDSNFEKVARVFKTTLTELREGDRVVPPTDPLFENLTKEDLRIARKYHDAETPIRSLTQRLLAGDLAESHILLSERIARLTRDSRTTLDAALESLETADRAEAAKRQPQHRATTKL